MRGKKNAYTVIAVDDQHNTSFKIPPHPKGKKNAKSCIFIHSLIFKDAQIQTLRVLQNSLLLCQGYQ